MLVCWAQSKIHIVMYLAKKADSNSEKAIFFISFNLILDLRSF